MIDRPDPSLVPPIDPRTKVDDLFGELKANADALRAAHRSLADEPDPYGPREVQLRELLERRDLLLRELGVVILRAVADGATVTVTPRWADDINREPTLDRSPGEEVPEPEPAPPVAPPPPAPPAVEAVAPPPPLEPEEPTVVEDAPRRPAPERRPTREPPSREPPPPKRVPRPPPTDLRGVLDLLGRPVRIARPEEGVDLVERLVDATSDLDRWLVLPQETQRALVGLVSSVARHVQDEADVDLPEHTWSELRAWFPAMTKWSKLYRPGFVPGLSRRNDPERGSWIADAEHWWWLLVDVANGEVRAKPSLPPPAEPVEPAADDDPPPADAAEALREVSAALADPESDLARALQRAQEAGLAARDPKLVRMLLPHTERIRKLPGLKTLKSALKLARRGDEPTEESAPGEERTTAVVPADWPFYEATAGRVAIVFGGDRRIEAAERMREAFRFASCTWEETDPRRVAALVGRIRARTVDLVILLRRYVAHAESDALVQACKEADVPYVAVDQGYGVGQVRLAIERYLRARIEAA